MVSVSLLLAPLLLGISGGGTSRSHGVPRQPHSVVGAVRSPKVLFLTRCMDEGGRDHGTDRDTGKAIEWWEVCMISLCALLRTTNPTHLLVLVGRTTPRHVLERVHSLGVDTQEVDPAFDCRMRFSETYPEDLGTYWRKCTFVKLTTFEPATVGAYDFVFWVDADAVSNTNQTKVVHEWIAHRPASFVAHGIGRAFGEQKRVPFNNGVYIIRPNATDYANMVALWESGQLISNNGKDWRTGRALPMKRSIDMRLGVSDQDVMLAHFVERTNRLRARSFPLCYSWRGYDFQLACAPRDIGFYHIRKVYKWWPSKDFAPGKDAHEYLLDSRRHSCSAQSRPWGIHIPYRQRRGTDPSRPRRRERKRRDESHESL
eukprot:Hpha_TRINITY_DN4871_c0_g1::TRINITY_DN4871_c0_g1_i1::g.20399::m.20399